jgi:FkbM family methyltransferase
MHDPYWTAVADFLRSEKASPPDIVAPREFDELLPGIVPYEMRGSRNASEFEWVVVHKGLMEELGREWLELIVGSYTPVFVNEVFVLFARGKEGYKAMKSIHFESFLGKLRSLAAHVVPPNAVRNERMAVYLGDHLALTKTIYGHKIYVDTRDYSLAPHILMDGYWEQWITTVFRQAIRAEMQVLDIGANLGWYSLIAADLVGPKGHVTSFEANPSMADIVYRNLLVNGFLDRAKVEAKAVYNESKQLEFQVWERYMGSSSLFATAETATSFNDTLKTVRVDAVSLDDYFPAGSQIDFIKVDAEGAEPYILKGATRLLTENRHVQVMMEFAPSILGPTSGDMLYREIAALGFSVWRIGHDSTLIKTSLDALSSATNHCDIILKR